MPDQRLSKEQLLEALGALTQTLVERDITARLYIVGGAAMALEYGTRDATRDIDAQYYPKDVVAEVALEVAREYGLPDDWLNDKAAMFISPVIDDENPTVFFSAGTVTVHIASARVLLALKIRASRPNRDTSDIEFLCKFLELSSVDQAVEVFESYYPEDPLPERAMPILRSILDSGPEIGPPDRGFGIRI